NDLRSTDVGSEELAEAKRRVAGRMVMDMQTIQQQAARRIETILNGYPADYFDKYPARVGEVTASQVREVMNRYVQDDRMGIVVIAPAQKVKEKLEGLGTVDVIAMPEGRSGGGRAASSASQ